MDGVDKQETPAVHIPPVPIKTYKWEDVKRARRKGGYPWTYLDKQPFDEEVDPEEFTMEGFRKSKSASTLGKESDGVTIQEITDADMDKSSQRPPSSQDGSYLKCEPSVEQPDSSGEDNISQYLDKDERDTAVEEVQAGPSQEIEELPPNGERKRAQSEEPKRKRKLSIESSYSRISMSKIGLMKKLKEAKGKLEKIKMPSMPKLPKIPSFKKSEKPEVKSEKPQVKLKSKKAAQDVVKSSLSKKQQEPKEEVKPVYIYIPLKPPPGETDEFSKFADEVDEMVKGPKKENEETKPENEEPETPSTPDTPGKSGVQLIILTAPSDDEILDGPDIPETPSDASSKDLFRERFEEMKTFAKDIIRESTPTKELGDDVTPMEVDKKEEKPEDAAITKEETKPEDVPSAEKDTTLEKETPDAKKEEPEKEVAKEEEEKQDVSKKGKKKGKKAIKRSTKEEVSKMEEKAKQLKEAASKTEKQEEPNKTDDEKAQTAIVEKPKPEPMLVDEEDGLKLSETAIQMINEEMEKELAKQEEEKKEGDLLPILKTEASPKAKKKVSFKRKIKSEDDYEEIEDKDKDKKPLETTQSMSVDEEKTYLDDKIIKATSLEEDYNKWSKLGDHEYEPINPPPEEGTSRAQPVKGAETGILKKLDSEDSQATGDELSAQELQNRMEDQFFNQPQPAQSTPEAAPGPTGGKAKFASIIKAAKAQAKAAAPKGSILKPSPQPASPPPSTSAEVPEDKEDTLSTKEKLQGHGRRIKAAFNTQAGRFKTRVQSIKRPTLSNATKARLAKLKPKKPTIKKPTMPKLSMPKMPEKMTFTLPKRGTAKRNLKARQLSTESNAGDSKKKLFDFSTVPRVFSRKQKQESPAGDIEDRPIESNTVPRTRKPKWQEKLAELKAKAVELPKKKDAAKKAEPSKKAKENEGKPPKSDSPVYIRIPLHSQESMDRENENEPSHVRYNQDIDVDDAYDKENREIHKLSQFSSDFKQPERWKHGTFHGGDELKESTNTAPNQEFEKPREYGRSEFKVTDLDNGTSESLSPDRRYDESASPVIHSSSSFGDIHRRGVLEEINSDEFFLRQKGISQDNIEVGAYLSSEIREAFKDPTNALQQMGYDDSFDKEGDITISDQSPEGSPKRKPIRKPKRKKTPLQSREKLTYEQESELEEGLQEPSRPKRRSKKKKKAPVPEDIVPYQETIHVDEPHDLSTENILHQESQFYLKNRNTVDDERQMYENEHMQGIEQPEIMLSDPYHREFLKRIDLGFMDEDNESPAAPPRKQRSLRSLNTSEHDSILGEYPSSFRDLQPHHPDLYKQDDIQPVGEAPLPPRRNRSRTRSRTTSHVDEDSIREEFMYENQQPCVEEPCVSELRDYMGYAIIDKKQVRDPPLPPSRIPPTPPTRRRKPKVKKIETTETETKFFTVPRSSKEPPQRPLRNYSTLGPSGSKKSLPNMTDEEKENVTQYIEIEDSNRDLQSGEVIQKMRDRPLPAPPRPPRKPRSSARSSLRDITNGQHIQEGIEETEVSTQTEPLPDDFVCEELVQETSDRVIIPRPYDNQETITHGSLVIERIESEIIPDLPRGTTGEEKVIPITRDEYDETSEIPEEFHKLKDPTTVTAEDESYSEVPEEFKQLKNPDVVDKPPERIPRRKESIKGADSQPQMSTQGQFRPDSFTDVELLRASKLQVGDLDVNRLTVNELLASKIKVSEIDSASIQVSEINSQGGNLVVSGIELPTNFIKELLEKLQEEAKKEDTGKTDEEGKKKTSTDEKEPVTENPPERPPRRKSEINLDTLENFEEENPYEEIKEKRQPTEPQVETKEEPKEQIEELKPTEPVEELEQLDDEQIENVNITIENVEEEPVVKEEPTSDSLQDDALLQPERPPRQKKSLDISLENLVSCEELRMEAPPEIPPSDETAALLHEEQLEQEENKSKETEPQEQTELKEETRADKPILERLESEFEIENEEALLEHLRNKHFLDRGIYSEDFSDMPGLEQRISIDFGSTSQENPIEEVIEEIPPVRPSRKNVVPDHKLADIESQILHSLEEEAPPQIPQMPSHFGLYDVDSKVLRDLETEFVKEVKERQELGRQQKDSSDNVQSKDGNTSEEPPPRPPQPRQSHRDDIEYLPSQPPPSFYDLRSPVFIDFVDDDIPLPPRRRRQKMQPETNSSSEEQPHTSSRRSRHRTPEPTVLQLTGQLTRACGTAIDRSLKRLITHITNCVLANSDGKQDLHVFIVMLLVLIAGLMLLGWGDGKTVHHHHWEYFNPPKNL